MLPSKYEPIRYFIFEQDAHLILASSCSNDYIHMYVIIYFLANLLVFQNMVTYKNFCTLQISTVNSHLLLTEALHKLTAGR